MLKNKGQNGLWQSVCLCDAFKNIFLFYFIAIKTNIYKKLEHLNYKGKYIPFK